MNRCPIYKSCGQNHRPRTSQLHNSLVTFSYTQYNRCVERQTTPILSSHPCLFIYSTSESYPLTTMFSQTGGTLLDRHVLSGASCPYSAWAFFVIEIKIWSNHRYSASEELQILRDHKHYGPGTGVSGPRPITGDFESPFVKQVDV